jgi:uncharacterized coiled-coil DUF342 family protein
MICAIERERDEAREALENRTASTIHSCHDQCQRPMCVLRRERDEARAERDSLRIDAQREAEHHDRMVNELQKLYNKLDKTRDIFKSVVDKANELIARWDAPSWKDTAPTARFINALRIAVRAYERNLK